MILTFYLLPQPYSVKLGAWFIRLFGFIRVKTLGTIDPDAQMYLLNHQSDVDIGIMETISSKNIAWVAKNELFSIPFFGLVLRLPKNIALQRESKTAVVKLIKEVKRCLDAGRVITIFPEGTRTETGKMKPFKQGAKIVADKYALKVQPIVLIATASYFSNKKRIFRPGVVTAVYMEAFYANKEDENWLINTQTAMQKVYDDELANHPRNR
ncbi:MAG TPA: lysophospholipid acyltransferase family protein [Sulfuricurvum sp.]|nr:MAG: 1-acyl-sn-glycerol-3-phosphate acyltransferase [Campylobacterales bacterium 16-40-21]OZA03481.1 MAG: 1-acyl-sn-glycerol-3-phosphate acyltransferase [Sulfuricurvum sp. 17-40-25]HQS66444.1 lysophospholipid acyltransferase family protein [Sulfuricurvum sp.]HQT37074.1 lysophospholipid acyltransferase family protein [Sulfuricurvum sp.]